MLQPDELIEILQDTVDSLTDRDIIAIDLCQIGLAVFPHSNRAIASPCFVDGSWHLDAETRDAWRELWGEGYPVRWLPVLTLLDNGEIAKTAQLPHQTVDHQQWVQAQAKFIRPAINAAIPLAAKQLASEMRHA